MDRYLEVAHSATPPSAPPASPGYPTNGNPQTATPASEPGEWWFHMITEEIRAVIVAAGLTPDHTDTNQLLDALRSAGVFQTALQFDNDTSVATTEFVRRQGQQFSKVTAITSAAVLTAADAGSLVQVGGSTSYNITLPAANSVPAGTAIEFAEVGAGTGTRTVVCAGADVLSCNGYTSPTSISLAYGDSVTFVSSGSVFWFVIGVANLKNSAQFGASLSANGYQKLPGGMILQWGSMSVTAGAAGSVTFPIAFPSQVLTFGAYATETSGATATRYAEIIYVSTSQASLIVNSGTALVHWHAIGK